MAADTQTSSLGGPTGRKPERRRYQAGVHRHQRGGGRPRPAAAQVSAGPRRPPRGSIRPAHRDHRAPAARTGQGRPAPGGSARPLGRARGRLVAAGHHPRHAGRLVPAADLDQYGISRRGDLPVRRACGTGALAARIVCTAVRDLFFRRSGPVPAAGGAGRRRGRAGRCPYALAGLHARRDRPALEHDRRAVRPVGGVFGGRVVRGPRPDPVPGRVCHLRRDVALPHGGRRMVRGCRPGPGRLHLAASSRHSAAGAGQRDQVRQHPVRPDHRGPRRPGRGPEPRHPQPGGTRRDQEPRPDQERGGTRRAHRRLHGGHRRGAPRPGRLRVLHRATVDDGLAGGRHQSAHGDPRRRRAVDRHRVHPGRRRRPSRPLPPPPPGRGGHRRAAGRLGDAGAAEPGPHPHHDLADQARRLRRLVRGRGRGLSHRPAGPHQPAPMGRGGHRPGGLRRRTGPCSNGRPGAVR